MTHKCFQCEKRFDSSGQLVQHMKESHSTFVQDANNKIDRSKEQYSHSFINTAATCPYCKMDCHTRKKLMRHLEEHRDLEPDTEQEDEQTELKIIRISNEGNNKSLLEQFDGEKAGSSGSGSSTVAAAAANNPTFVQNIIRAIESDPAKIAASKIKISSTSLKLPIERRYKCFWCDTSFRKRGKLMDHIDMFHKANKHQTELEAELLQGVSRDFSAVEVEKPKPATNRQSSSSSVSSSLNSTNSKGSSAKDSTTGRSKSCDKPILPAPPKPRRKCCTFSIFGSICEEPKVRPPTTASVDDSCKFYFGSIGNLPVKEEPPQEPSPSPSPSPVLFTGLDSLSSHFSSTHMRHMRSTSISSNSSQPPQASPQAHPHSSTAAAQFPNFSMREASLQAASANSFRQPPQLGARNQPLAPALFPHMPYYMPASMPASDLYLNQQHNMIIEQQRSQLQYLYMQSLVSQQSTTAVVDPNRPLDLSKTTK